MARAATQSRAILAVVSDDEAEPTRLVAIASAVQLSTRHVGAMLTFLLRRGYVRRVGKGLYVRVRE